MELTPHNKLHYDLKEIRRCLENLHAESLTRLKNLQVDERGRIRTGSLATFLADQTEHMRTLLDHAMNEALELEDRTEKRIVGT